MPPSRLRLLLPMACFCALLALGGGFAATVRAADGAADAVAALSQLTSPARLAALPESTFAAQLGPALGWLHVGRRRDISPEAIIARAFQANGLQGSERGRLTREALLRNLARADAWELFNHAASAQAMALGQPAVIQVGAHRGQFARAVLLSQNQNPVRSREFADLALRADDELPPRPVPKARRPRPDERLAARRKPPPPGRPRARVAALPTPAGIIAAPIEYDALPASD